MKIFIFFAAFIILVSYSFDITPAKAQQAGNDQQQVNFVIEQSAKSALDSANGTQTDLTAPISPAKAKMLFRREFNNYARGYRNSGWFINEKGDVYNYEYGRDSQNRDQFNFKTPPTLIGHIEPGVLTQKRLLIKKAARGTFTQKHAAYDAGVGIYSAFLRDSKGGFKEIKLKEYGDTAGMNSAPEAGQLAKWLEMVFTKP